MLRCVVVESREEPGAQGASLMLEDLHGARQPEAELQQVQEACRAHDHETRKSLR